MSGKACVPVDRVAQEWRMVVKTVLEGGRSELSRHRVVTMYSLVVSLSRFGISVMVAA